MLRYKILHDLFHHKTRTLLAVFSIASGVFAVGAIFGMVDQLLSGMDAAHQAVNPSHVNIILRDYIPQAVADDLETLPGVAAVDAVNQVSVRYRLVSTAAVSTGSTGESSLVEPVETNEWELGTIVQRPDYANQTYDQVVLKEGNWPLTDSIAIERLSGSYFGVGMADAVTFEIGDSQHTLTVTGVIRHPFVQPPLFGGQAHFFVDAATLEDLFGIPAGYFGQLLVRVEPYSLANAQEVAGDMRARLAEQGYGVAVSLYQEPDRHWGRMFVEGINWVMQLMALVALFLSVVLVWNTMTALITQQVDQIGVLKAIGARWPTIAGVYLAQVLIFGLLALLIALPTAALFAWGVGGWFLGLFNIDFPPFQVSTRAVVLQIVAGLLAPLLAALVPVLQGARLSVRQAIASYGLGGDFGSSRLDRAVERIGAAFLPTLYAASLGNLFRRKGRLALTLLVLITAGVMFLVVMSLISSVTFTLDNEMARQGYDVRIGFAKAQPVDDVLTLANGVPGVSAAEMWHSRNATLLRAGERLQDSAGLGAQLLGIPPDTAMYRPIITVGRWLQAADADARVIVISAETAEKNGIAVGDTVTLDLGAFGAAEWEVVGAYRVLYGSGFVVEPIYAPLAAMDAATGLDDVGTQVLVRGNVTSLAEEEALSDALQEAFEDAGMGIDFYTTSARLDARVYADNQFNSVISMLLSLALLAAMVGGIGLMGALGISVVERRREIGVLRSVGARSPAMMALFVMEGVLQALISFVLAVPLAFALARPLAERLGLVMLEVRLDYAFNFAAVGVWFGLVLAIAVLASILPARSATQISVRESLMYT
jgi:putative ABC transport system permease protein